MIASTHTGPLASASWLAALEVFPSDPRWFVEIALVAPEARFTVEIYREEWGFTFSLGERQSWIRVTDLRFVHGRDDFQLLSRTPRLDAIGSLLRDLEHEHALAFDCLAPRIQSSFGRVDAIRAWVRATTSAGTRRG